MPRKIAYDGPGALWLHRPRWKTRSKRRRRGGRHAYDRSQPRSAFGLPLALLGLDPVTLDRQCVRPAMTPIIGGPPLRGARRRIFSPGGAIVCRFEARQDRVGHVVIGPAERARGQRLAQLFV